MKIILYIILSFIGINACFSQSIKLNFEQISVADGLSQSEVYSICQDQTGYIWIGTIDGLNKYDGYDMIVYKNNPLDSNSISSNHIKKIFEDKLGNLWVCTYNGLNLYNKESDNFSRFQQLDSASPGLTFIVNNIIQRQNGDLLFATNHGLSILTHEKREKGIIAFENYFKLYANNLFEDKLGYIWLTTLNDIYKIRIDETGTPHILFKHFQYIQNSKKLISNFINCIYQDKEGDIWFGTESGINLLSSKELFFDKPNFSLHEFGLQAALRDSRILCMMDDSKEKLVVGTRGNGLCFIDKKSKEILTYKVDEFDKYSINNNMVKCLFEDKTGVLWIGTLGGGCNKVDLNQKKFYNYKIKLNNDNAKSNFIRSVYEDNDKILWIGTIGDGLFTYNEKSNQYSRFPSTYQIEIDKNISSNIIYGENVFAINDYGENELWVSSNGGINVINKENGKVAHNLSEYSNPDSLMNNSVFSIAKDDDGSFWVGTWEALHRYILPATGKKGYFVRYRNDEKDSNSISDNIIRYIYNDPINTDIWVGTMSGGLNRLIKQEGNSLRIIRYEFDKNNPGSISNNSITMISRTKNGDLWVTTKDGINKFVPGLNFNDGSFKRFNKKNGLEGNNVQSILEDDKGNLWLGTNRGISKFNTKTEEFTNFNEGDGILSNEFSEHSCFKNPEGKMFFGGVNGFTSFYPDSIVINNSIPNARFTKLILANRVVSVGELPDGRVILSKPLSDTKKIELSYKDRFFIIEFSALHYAAPKRNKYAYKIEGVHDDWIYTDYQNRRVTFTNLKGGTYTLKVKASNNDEQWQINPTTLIIKINPPIWLTWPAKLIYVIIVFLILYFIIREFKLRERLKTQVTLKNLEIEKADELNNMKLQFFTNISHEFRTPLTLIITPLENMLNSSENISKDQLKIMYRNSKYLLNLTSELIEFRKTESVSLKIKASEINIVEYISNIFLSFEEIIKRKNIEFEFIAKFIETKVWFDKEMMNKVFNNLLFNAYKFTPERGKISIVIEKGEENIQYMFADSFRLRNNEHKHGSYIYIKIIDTGIGISPESLEKIFDLFYQVGSSDSKDHLGSGIGLALSKKLILINKGEIAVSSERNKGTEFVVCLPLGDEHLAPEEKMSINETENITPFVFASPAAIYNDGEGVKLTEISSFSDENYESETILIVEDNDELRTFVKDNLAAKYQIIEAKNGLEGYNLAIDLIPDLVISDVMMPEMDGIELCAKLKNNILTSHIPVILLTALASVSDQIAGLETGADDYISKPFVLKLFELRIKNLLLSRKILRERFGTDMDMTTKDITMNPRDQEFLDTTIQIITKNISDPEFNVSKLSRELLMSRTNIFRKIKALTGQSPNEFIRIIKLKEAASLFKMNRFSIFEVADQVGFASPSYFSSCFKKQFNMSPKEYISKLTSLK